MRRALIVGGGIFGITAAVELRRRSWAVTVVDRARVPNPDASSTDTSKLVRMDYGNDRFYHELAEAALEGWDRWNRDLPTPLYHETGFLVLAAEEMAPGGFEHDSFQILDERGFGPVRLADHAEVLARGPWMLDAYPDGYLSRRAGWVECDRVVEVLIEKAKSIGVVFREGMARKLSAHGSKITGVTLDNGSRLGADCVVVSAGAWTPQLVPELAGLLTSVAQPVLYFKPPDPSPYHGENFPTWAADTSREGWYGFPSLPDGRVKVGHHGKGIPVEPDRRLPVGHRHEQRTRAFLKNFLPELAKARVDHRRTCMYCDSLDGDFVIARHPWHDGLVVASGGSGHGFKFAPLLGEIVANVVEGHDEPRAERFQWRTEITEKLEASRSRA
ncbi:MAG: FAD-dependent oxidoreductase [Gemmatimonadetes bacterium]|nr:FAD-dependent oxidoreductase [Gemmatimonadota bacterium]